jgi:hypothetical protein
MGALDETLGATEALAVVQGVSEDETEKTDLPPVLVCDACGRVRETQAAPDEACCATNAHLCDAASVILDGDGRSLMARRL